LPKSCRPSLIRQESIALDSLDGMGIGVTKTQSPGVSYGRRRLDRPGAAVRRLVRSRHSKQRLGHAVDLAERHFLVSLKAHGPT
jgi:hypothetical protein